MKDLLEEMQAYAAQAKVPIINSQGRKVFVDTVRKKQAHNVLEIGTAIGYSTLLLAANSAPGAKVTSLELDEARVALAKNYIDRSPYKQQINIIVGDAAVNLLKLTNTYDLVFIDAAKGQYPRYFNSVLPLLNEDSVIIADNVLFRGLVRSNMPVPHRYRTIVTRLREYIKLVAEHPEFSTKIYENGDGLAVSERKGEKL